MLGRAWLTESGRGRALRLLTETSKGLTVGVVVLILANALLPNLMLVSTGVAVGHLAAATKGGFGSPAGHQLVRALVAAGIFFAGSLLIGPYEDLLTIVVRLRVNEGMQRRIMHAVSAPTGVAHLEDPAVLDRLANAQGQLLNVAPADAPVTLAGLIGNRLSGIIACGIVGWFEWWLGLGLLVLWVAIRKPVHDDMLKQVQYYLGGASVLRRSFYFLQTALRPEAAKELRIFGLQHWIVEQYRSHWFEAMAAPFAHRRAFNRRAAGLSIIVLAAYLVAGGAVAWAGAHHEIGIGEVSVVLVMLVSTMSAGGVSLGDFTLAQMLTAIPDVDGLEASLRDQDASLSGALPAANLPEHVIRFDRVGFRYPRATADVLSDLDLVIPAGRSTAVVGLNGAGKTTLIKLLARLHDPTAGTIWIDGVPLRELRPDAWQRQVSVVYQEFNRYPLSARENIGLGAHEHLDDFEGIKAAARRTGSLETIEALSQGWETVLSRSYEGGADLSGGQWQRIALARSLFAVQHGARILVLDEPTSWLDVRGEAAFFDRFLEITAGVTSIIISHRFSTVRRADHICVLSDGRIVEEGGHRELVAAGGRYADIFALQAARFSEPEPSE
jgi:ATP-binding cassette, subfamily B, bacterial